MILAPHRAAIVLHVSFRLWVGRYLVSSIKILAGTERRRRDRETREDGEQRAQPGQIAGNPIRSKLLDIKAAFLFWKEHIKEVGERATVSWTGYQFSSKKNIPAIYPSLVNRLHGTLATWSCGVRWGRLVGTGGCCWRLLLAADKVAAGRYAEQLERRCFLRAFYALYVHPQFEGNIRKPFAWAWLLPCWTSRRGMRGPCAMPLLLALLGIHVRVSCVSCVSWFSSSCLARPKVTMPACVLNDARRGVCQATGPENTAPAIRKPRCLQSIASSAAIFVHFVYAAGPESGRITTVIRWIAVGLGY